VRLGLAVAALVALGACADAPRADAPRAPIDGAPTPSAPIAAPRAAQASAAGPTITVTLPEALSKTPLDGRLLVILAIDGAREPKTQVSDHDDTAQIFGVDVDGLRPGQSATIDARTFGYPKASLAEVPPGDYFVQAVLHRYETFVRGDGHTVKLPPDRGEGQDWTIAPGNLVSAPKKVRIDRAGGDVAIELASALPELPPVADTAYVKHVKMKSERLTTFWGRPTYLGAVVLLPAGFDAHPKARYPIAIEHGHFQRTSSFREAPPDAKLPPVDLEALRRLCPNGHEGARCTDHGYERLKAEQGYAFYKEWTGPRFPRVITVAVQHANPYYDDSYAVNSENVGPYGDAITYELLPYIEEKFRGLGPWARGAFGGSTGGWEAMAAQVLYPDQYNGIIANCPDPIDFRATMTLDLYTEKNAYYHEGPLRRTSRPGERDYLGQVRSTMEQQNARELALGTRSRSGGQWDIWEAVYSPVGADGYPRRIWDKRTGAIDPEVAAYWREHYDLGHILRRDWARLAPLLRGKITLNVGLADNFFLNDAVYLVEDFFKTAKPPADAVVDYGPRDEHCWSGDHSTFNGVSRLTYVPRFVRKLADHWKKTAPKGADVTSWWY